MQHSRGGREEDRIGEDDTYTGGFLASMLESEFNSQIAIRVSEPGSELDGKVFIVKDTKAEYHEDTASTTFWIEVVEY